MKGAAVAMRYLVSGPVNIDRIYPLINGSYSQSYNEVLGGGGVYALSALKLWTDNCIPVDYVGTDFFEKYSSWFVENGIILDGMSAVFDETVKTLLYYQEDGRYIIKWKQGDLGTGRGTVNMQLLKPFLHEGIKGIHLVAHGNIALFSQLNEYRDRLGIKIGYEINNTNEFYVNAQGFIEEVTKKYVDFFSVSFGEMCGFFRDVSTIREAIKKCASFGCPIYLRAGIEGGYLINNGICWHIPMTSDFGSKDATGCGNTSTAAVFWALSEGYSEPMAGVIGSVTAGLNASHLGLIDRITGSLREECMALAEKKFEGGFAERVEF